MKPSADIVVIINPASAAGKTAREIPRILAAIRDELPGRHQFLLTHRPGHAIDLAAEAAEASVPLIVAVGGDGTINEVVNGILSACDGRSPVTTLAVVSSGSGQGLALSLGFPTGVSEQIRMIASGEGRVIDIGLLAGLSDGRETRRYFVNECQFGIGAEVVRRNGRRLKIAGGLLGYGAATLASIFTAPNVPVRVAIEDEPPLDVTLLGISIGNGHLTGGGMSLTPDALFDDGLLNVLLMYGQSVPQRLESFPKIYSGAHIHSPCFDYRTAHRIAIRSTEGVLAAADGEFLGKDSWSVDVIPAAIRIIGPPSQLRKTNHQRAELPLEA
ncbi:MAG: diacylglycerol kinase family protein [Bacteroidota bacterium]